MSHHSPTQPLLSVVMPAYNGAEYLGEAIRSILTQTYSAFEFIIVDDGSTDDSARIIHEWAERDARIRPYFLEHGGVARAMNFGVRQARGALLARMDDDDIALPHRFATQLEWMRERQLDVCGSCAMAFGERTGALWFPESHDTIRRELIFRPAMLFPTLLMRTEIYLAHPLAAGVRFDDYALCSQLAPHYRLGNAPQFLLRYRNHARQTLRVSSDAISAEGDIYRRRCFQDLFPNATPQEWARYECIANAAPFVDTGELERAGAWLAALAQSPDNLHRQWLAKRWGKACRASAALGAERERVYREYLARINPDALADDYDL